MTPADIILGGPRQALIVDPEIAQAVRRHVARGDINAERAAVALDDLAALPLHRHRHDLLMSRVWALPHDFSAHDAVYVAPAEELGAMLLTCDRKFAAAALLHTWVTVI